uniref:Uncharacterized protein n=1 Tax=Cacopsylla melanoneura TaxID=428564 RepID=A0A8D8XTB5_9HEMI
MKPLSYFILCISYWKIFKPSFILGPSSRESEERRKIEKETASCSKNDFFPLEETNLARAGIESATSGLKVYLSATEADFKFKALIVLEFRRLLGLVIIIIMFFFFFCFLFFFFFFFFLLTTI